MLIYLLLSTSAANASFWCQEAETTSQAKQRTTRDVTYFVRLGYIVTTGLNTRSENDAEGFHLVETRRMPPGALSSQDFVAHGPDVLLKDDTTKGRERKTLGRDEHTKRRLGGNILYHSGVIRCVLRPNWEGQLHDCW